MNKFITFLLILAVSTTAAFGQQVKSTINSTLSGQVLDEKTKEPIPGVSLYIKGTTHGVITDAEGHFYFQTGQKFLAEIEDTRREFFNENKNRN